MCAPVQQTVDGSILCKPALLSQSNVSRRIDVIGINNTPNKKRHTTRIIQKVDMSFNLPVANECPTIAACTRAKATNILQDVTNIQNFEGLSYMNWSRKDDVTLASTCAAQ